MGAPARRGDARSPTSFLASDYVRTYTDLATMEGANEAARRAVNAILDAHGLARAALRRLEAEEPEAFAFARTLDRIRWRLFRRPARSPLRVGADGAVEPTGRIASRVLRAGRLSSRRGG